MIVLADAEYRTIVSSFVWTNHRNATKGRTDGQTDRIPLASTVVVVVVLYSPNTNRYITDTCKANSDSSGLHCEQCGPL